MFLCPAFMRRVYPWSEHTWIVHIRFHDFPERHVYLLDLISRVVTYNYNELGPVSVLVYHLTCARGFPIPLLHTNYHE